MSQWLERLPDNRLARVPELAKAGKHLPDNRLTWVPELAIAGKHLHRYLHKERVTARDADFLCSGC